VKVQNDVSNDVSIDVLDYDFIFAGSGVYEWLPGKPLMELFSNLRRKYVQDKEIRPASPLRPEKKAVVYCTYGGVHTGVNEAVPAVKYMGQLFDHLGITIIGEWYIIGEFGIERLKEHSINGRLGNIQGRPNQQDLREVAERVKGIFRV